MGIDLQRINVKMLAQAPPDFELNPFLAIFGRWRNDKEHPEVWVDLADYAHMPKGPGVVLIGKRGNFSIDLADPAPGLLYCGKRDYEGSNEQRILETFRRGIGLVKPLLAEADYPPQLQLQPEAWELTFNDRLDTPNTDATDAELRPGIDAALKTLFGDGGYEAQRETDPERRYAFSIRAKHSIDLDALGKRAGA